MSRIRAVALAAIVTITASGCSAGSDSSAFAQIESTGRVLVEHADGTSEVVDGSTGLAVGDEIEALDGATVVSFGSGSTIELLEGDADDEASRLRLAPIPELTRGEALVSGDLTLDAGESSVAVAGGAARVVRSLAVVTKVYEGTATISSTNRDLEVGALREAAVASAGLLPSSPDPLVYDASHPWDRRFLGAAMALGDQLTARARGFTSQLAPGEGRSPGFYRLLLPDLEDEAGFDGDLLSPDRAPGETLIGAAITVASEDSSSTTRFERRWNDVFEFRDAGAAWGLVVLDQHVGESPLVESIDAAIGRAPLLALPSPNEPTVAPPVLTETTAPDDDDPPPSTEPEPDPEPEPPPTSPPTTEQRRGPVTGLLDDLLGGGDDEDGDDDEPSDSPGGEQDPGLLGQLLRGVNNLLGDVVGGLLGG